MRSSKINRSLGALSLSLLAAMALSGAALAGVGEGGEKSSEEKAQKMTSELDTDGDGRISSAEHSTYAQTVFDRIDADDDGNLTATEMETGHQQLQGDEVAAMWDNDLSRVSMVSGGSMAGTQAPDGQMPNGETQMPDGSAAGAQPSELDRVQRLDGNGDSMVSADEYAAAAQGLFSHLDSDGDAALSTSELSGEQMQDADQPPY